MPALNPPSMQIGALPPGFSTLSPQPAGPGLAYGQNVGLPSLVQQVAGASSSAAPASFTLSGITATAVGSYLVVLVAVAESGAATVSTPAGWTAVAGGTGNSPGNTIGGRIFVLPNNAGGITSVAFTSLTGVNGIACWFSEWRNVFAIDGGYATTGNQGGATYVNSSTTPSAPAYTATAGPAVLVGMETDLTGQVYTPANVGANWTTGTTATSSVGATNCIIRPFFNITDPVEALSYQIAGSLAGALANGDSMVSLLPATGGPLLQPQPQAWLGAPVVAGAWGALGGTKPGGAGSGQ